MSGSNYTHPAKPDAFFSKKQLAINTIKIYYLCLSNNQAGICEVSNSGMVMRLWSNLL